MVTYTPPPEDLTKLNAVQRYMQKGSLDSSDYLRLIAVVAAYWFLRPYIQKAFKKLSGSEFQEGEDEQAAYQQRRAKAKIGANNIRVSKDKPESQTIGDILDGDATTSSTQVPEKSSKTNVTNRKKGVAFAPEKTAEEKLEDWDDEPSRRPVEGDKSDVMKWLDKWENE